MAAPEGVKRSWWMLTCRICHREVRWWGNEHEPTPDHRCVARAIRPFDARLEGP